MRMESVSRQKEDGGKTDSDAHKVQILRGYRGDSDTGYRDFQKALCPLTGRERRVTDSRLFMGDDDGKDAPLLHSRRKNRKRVIGR